MNLSPAYLNQREEWRQEGLQEGEVTLLLCLLRRRFGEIAPDLGQRITSLSIPQLEALVDAQLDFSNTDEDEDEDKYKLCNLYNNNPLKIRVAANTIINLFNKDINNFLEQNTFVFSSIRHLLDRQFHRLSTLEHQVMYWLQINQQLTTINYLHTKIVPTVSKAKLFDAVESLIRRSLIETGVGGYTQSPIVMEYVREVFTEEIIPLLN